MKVQITIEVSDQVRALIASRMTGEFRLATREETKEFARRPLDGMVKHWEEQAQIVVDHFQVQNEYVIEDGKSTPVFPESDPDGG